MLNIALVAIGGAIGSIARYLVGVWSVRLAGPNFPWGTLTVNVVGAFLIGLTVEVIARRFDASSEMRVLLVTGVIGGFTTWSSFTLDAVVLFERGEIGLSALYLGASLLVSFAAIFAGLALGRALF
ncbi:fluoride efflux transporter CrcB [Agrobacterium rosae]|uniref:Fluoride-specific ion channel FluC n=1 Tax=Agrobacterium rosae TaxID=1972867 RepID=A0AAE5RWX9_9HYPH|nr:fluoride efflux transporter CrcB [Agrobacterium rosae]KAA3509857.1 fluoride efflux transporter CrcB [Agrobacterium rosae]KAA3515195.1 fluoride efflux transporter CrcB [Agrobacterium rosae]MCM2433051.1 fluoride efflux transporter CrcB [Agrobacterium rosae]MDX8300918.1 fluoride efflux transporter CrcB [Agrobacterium rosae]MDX8313718.1 fluoride efflux transporter CrcB [Agrobacterium rosae]